MILLQRFQTSDQGTFGKLFNDDGELLCYTVERPYTGDHPCIPVGTYTWVTYDSPTKGSVWLCQPAPEGRSEIEMHVAQIYTQLLGCIGVGDMLGTLEGLPAVMHSVDTFQMLKATLPGTFSMQITDISDTI